MTRLLINLTPPTNVAKIMSWRSFLSSLSFQPFGGLRQLYQRTSSLKSHCSALFSTAAGTDTTQYKMGYSDLPQLDESSDAVKKIYSIEFASQKEKNKLIKAEMIKKFQQRPGDTGSLPVEIGIITARIQHLTAHMRKYKKDKSCLHRLLQLVDKQRKLLKQMRKRDFTVYHFLLKELDLRPINDNKYANFDKKKKKK